MANTPLDYPAESLSTWNEDVARSLEQLVRSMLGTPDRGIPWSLNQYDGPDPALSLRSLEPTVSLFADFGNFDDSVNYNGDNSGHAFGGPVTMNGTLTVSSLTPGSVLFAGSSGLVAQDNGNIFWDDSTNRLGLGASSPQDQLHVALNARILGRLGVAAAPHATIPFFVNGQSQLADRTGIGGLPDATVMLKVTGDEWITSKLGVGTTPDASFMLKVAGGMWATGNGQIDGNLKVDSATFNVDGANNRVGVLTATPGCTLESNGQFRVTASTGAPSAGEGLEIGYSAGLASIAAFNRSGGVYTNLNLGGAAIKLGINASQAIGLYGVTAVAQQSIATAATDLASVITLANDLRSKLRTLGVFA